MLPKLDTGIQKQKSLCLTKKHIKNGCQLEHNLQRQYASFLQKTNKILMKKLLEYLVRGITKEENIAVVKTQEGEVDIYKISVPQNIIGLLIGKEGRTIRAIRAIARIKAIKDNKKIKITLEQ